MMTATPIGLIVLGLCLVLCYAGLWVGAAPEGPSVPHFLGVMALAFPLYGVACWLAMRLSDQRSLWVIVPFAVVFRLLIAGPVLYDDDIYRYHWDGKVLASGRNPYKYAPADLELADLRDGAWERIGHKSVKTIHPPATSLLSAATYWLSPRPGRIRVVAVLFDLATLVPIVLILLRLGLSPTLMIVYAWNPLPIKEFANSGHLDSVAVFSATFALYALTWGRPAVSGLLWGLSFLGKTWTLLLAPLYVRRRKAFATVAFAGVVAAGVGPFLGAGDGLLEGSRTYARTWEFNSGLFALESMAADWLGCDAGPIAKTLNSTIWMALAMAIIAAGERDATTILRRAALLISTALLLSPGCNPWYVCWLLPLLCIHRSPAWLTFTGLVMLSYVWYHDPGLDPPGRVVQYGILGALLAWEQISRDPNRLWRGLTGRLGRRV
jgi:alpha-1,6-mannosyltransferase